MLIFFVSLLIIYFIQSAPFCKEGINNCKRCDPLTHLCLNCDLDIYSPNENGGCSPLGKCFPNKNHCKECDEVAETCKNCDIGFYPDSNGACSLVEKCEISYRGYCLKCDLNYILIGEEQGIKICKSVFSEDLQNCATINSKTGLCDACEKDYFLNSGDKKCSGIENCYESMYGRCLTCNTGFYLNVKLGSCELQKGSLFYCKETIDGKKCDKCEDDYFFDEKGNCTSVNYCHEGEFICKKCIDDYFLTKDGNSCTKEEHCYSGDKLNGLCNYCIENYYIDLNDRKCKSNKEDNEYKHCTEVENDLCVSCENDYYLSEDGKCTTTKNCAEVSKDKCIACSDNYYLGLDNRCSNVKHCIYSDNIFQCNECEDGFYYNSTSQVCLEYTEGFENCKLTTFNQDYYCYYCKNGFYINQTNHLCYNNKEKNDFYKCMLTDMNGEYCIRCEDNYFVGYTDHKCSKISGCLISENEEKCLECGERYCLDTRTGKCEFNDRIEDEEQKLYYRCRKTNEEGNACEICLDEYELSEEGYCVDKTHCIEEENGVCIKCKNNREYSSCLNKYFGCVPTSYMKCIECDNNLDFDICTKCRGDYRLTEEGVCVEIEDE